MHTGPIKRAGGFMASVHPDGRRQFRPHQLRHRPGLGTEASSAISRMAAAHNAVVIDDIVPRTPARAGFRLAEMGYKDYPGLYTWWKSPEDDWPLLPGCRRAAMR